MNNLGEKHHGFGVVVWQAPETFRRLRVVRFRDGTKGSFTHRTGVLFLRPEARSGVPVGAPDDAFNTGLKNIQPDQVVLAAGPAGSVVVTEKGDPAIREAIINIHGDKCTTTEWV